MIEDFISNHFLMNKVTIRDKLMNQIGGGDSLMNNSIHYIIGIILLIIGFLLYNSQDQWGKTIGVISNVKCNLNVCDSLVKYSVGEINFTKILVSQENIYKVSDHVEIIYDKINPNIFKLHEFNYKYIGVIIMIIGIFTIIKS